MGKDNEFITVDEKYAEMKAREKNPALFKALDQQDKMIELAHGGRKIFLVFGIIVVIVFLGISFLIISNFMNFSSDMEKDTFNATFELKTGIQSGFFVTSLFDDVIDNNRKDSNLVINVIYEDINTIDIEEIENIQLTISSFKDYRVSFDYDENGFINSLTLKDL